MQITILVIFKMFRHSFEFILLRSHLLIFSSWKSRPETEVLRKWAPPSSGYWDQTSAPAPSDKNSMVFLMVDRNILWL